MADTKKKVYKRKCTECGKKFETTGPRTFLCPSCKKAKAAARRKQRAAKQRKRSQEAEVNEVLKDLSTNNLQVDLTGLDELFPAEIWEQRPVDLDTFLFDRNYLGNAWLDTKGKKTMFPFWEEMAHKIFPLPMRSPYHTVILSGSTGQGKTSFAMGVLCAYYLHIVLCLRNPHEYFDLADQKNIVFAILNIVTKAMAFKNAWGIIHKMLLRSPWFMARGASTGGRRPEWYCTTKPVELVYGRNADDLIGLDILFAFMDEVSFARNQSIDRQIEIATEVFNAALERMKSRFTKFGGIYEGLMCMASSKRTDVSFLESFTKNLIETFDSNRIFIVDKPRWEVLPPETYKGPKFPVALGDKYRPSEIIPFDKVQKYEDAGYGILWPPEEYLPDFQRDMNSALTNIAGVSVGQISSFLPGHVVVSCINKGLQNIFTQEIIFSNYTDPDNYYDYIDLTRCRPEDYTQPLYIHLDASLGNDGNSMVGVLLDYAVNQKGLEGKYTPELHYRQLFKMKVRAKQGGRTSLEKNRQLIFWFIQHGFNLKGVSHDQYQSAEFHEILDKKGVPVYQQSIDAVKNGICPPYEDLKTILYEHRIDLLPDEDQKKELVSLEKYEGGRVDKPKGGNDDTSQCLAGAVFLASKAKEAVLYSGEVLLRQVGSSLDDPTGPQARVEVNLAKELEQHFATYSPNARVVQQDSGGRRDELLEVFFGPQGEKKKQNSSINPGAHWG